jgi:gluconokinase
MKPSTEAPLRAAPIVVMGVSGSGKTTFGSALARLLGRDFVDGDDLQSASNIDKMRRGHALDDSDRAPWLRSVAALLADHASHPTGLVVACSALKRTYRDVLRSARGVRFVFLDADRSLVEQRLDSRSGHFMPRTLIESQFDALERPGPAECDVSTFDAALPLEAGVRAAAELFVRRVCSADFQ